MVRLYDITATSLDQENEDNLDEDEDVLRAANLYSSFEFGVNYVAALRILLD